MHINSATSVFLIAALVGCATGPMDATRQDSAYPAYPQQANLITERPFERPDLETHTFPASPTQVRAAFGPEFASLPRLGVVLVLVTNRGRQTPITVSRNAVRLTLPDGQVLKALEPPEMVAWLQEAYGGALEKDARAAIFGHYTAQQLSDNERGVFSAAKGRGMGDMYAFRFPKGIPSGQFAVQYVLDLGSDGQIAVTQKGPLNLRP